MKTGIEQMADERQEQIVKHGYDGEFIQNNPQYYEGKELAFVAEMALAIEHEEGIDPNSYPESWPAEDIDKILRKPYKQRLVIAGALIAAEIDRLQPSADDVPFKAIIKQKALQDSTKAKLFTWAQLKEFCNRLTDEQLSQTVKMVSPDSEMSSEIKFASELGNDYYNFYDAEEVLSRHDFDKEYHFEGKYKSFDEAIENEEYIVTPSTNVYLFDE